MTTHRLEPDDVDEIRVFVGDYHKLMCSPLEQRRAPRTLMDARFSLPFLVASAVVHKGLSVWDFTASSLRDRQVLDVARKVVPIADSEYDWKFDLPPGRVEIVTCDGREFSMIGTEVPGSPEAPMTWSQLVSKFEECASAAAERPSPGQIADVIGMVRELESLEDVTEILRVLH